MPTVAHPHVRPVRCPVCENRPTVRVEDGSMHIECLPGYTCHSKNHFSVFRTGKIEKDARLLIETWNEYHEQ